MHKQFEQKCEFSSKTPQYDFKQAYIVLSVRMLSQCISSPLPTFSTSRVFSREDDVIRLPSTLTCKQAASHQTVSLATSAATRDFLLYGIKYLLGEIHFIFRFILIFPRTDSVISFMMYFETLPLYFDSVLLLQVGRESATLYFSCSSLSYRRRKREEYRYSLQESLLQIEIVSLCEYCRQRWQAFTGYS